MTWLIRLFRRRSIRAARFDEVRDLDANNARRRAVVSTNRDGVIASLKRGRK